MPNIPNYYLAQCKHSQADEDQLDPSLLDTQKKRLQVSHRLLAWGAWVLKRYLFSMIYMRDLKVDVECEHTLFRHLEEFMTV